MRLEPIYVQIARQVRTWIATGKLAPGERLPTHRQLGLALGVNRATVQRSYAELERVGLVSSEGSRGTLVAEAVRGGKAQRSWSFSAVLASCSTTPSAVHPFRAVLCVICAL